MKSKFLFLLFTGISVLTLNAQSIKETFDSNSLNWNETADTNNAGNAIIDKGVLTITSNGFNPFLTAMTGTKQGETYFTCFCYAPLNMQKPFKIVSNVTIGKLDTGRLAGLIFNYKDDGTFYAFVFDETEVRFLRYVDNRLVGYITQSVKWGKTKKMQQEWNLEYDGSSIQFTVNDFPIMKIRYMPLEYAGFGYYTFGKQKLIVDDVEFFQ